MFQAIRQGTKEDHPFDVQLHDAFKLADKGLDERERAQMRRARVRLLLYPQLEEEERSRLEVEATELEKRAAEALTEDERARLAEATHAEEKGDHCYTDLERSLRQHVESAELRLNPAARDKLLQARKSGGPTGAERATLEAEKLKLETKAWATLSEQERVALEFFEQALPTTPEARDRLASSQRNLMSKALQLLDPASRERVEAADLQARAESSLSEEERKKLRQGGEAEAQDAEIQRLRAKAEEFLPPADRTVLLRARLLDRREEAERALDPKERKSLAQARSRLIKLGEREELERSAEQRLSNESRARLDYLRDLLTLRRDHEKLRERAEQSLAADDLARLQRLRAQLRVSPKERQRLDRRLRQLAFGNLSNEKATFSKAQTEREALQEAHDYLRETLSVAPFNTMLDSYALEDDERGAERLCELLMRETRLRTFNRKGAKREVIVRQGDYWSTAFLILEGSVRILIQNDEQARATAASMGSAETRRKGWFGLLKRWLWASAGREVRKAEADDRYANARARAVPVPITVKNFDRLPAQNKEHTLREGEVFGEIAALTRSPRTASVLPESDVVRLLEIRWQGLRDLVNEDESFQKYVEERYRDSSRRAYVFRAGLFAGVGDTDTIRDLIAKGDLDGLFRSELGWRPPRLGAGLGRQAKFKIATEAPTPLTVKLRVWIAGKEEMVEVPPGTETFLIGSGEGCDLRLPRRPTVSDGHLQLRLRHGRWYLRNLSRHGTVVDGERVRKQVVLHPGAKLRVGDNFWIMFLAEAKPQAGTLSCHLFAQSPVHNGIGGVKAYRVHRGTEALPSEAECSAVAEQIKRREYLSQDESRHVVIFTRDGGEQDWRWVLPAHDRSEPNAQEFGSHRYRSDPTPIVDQVIHNLAMEEVVKVTEFLSFGKFRWFERSGEEEQDGTHWSSRLAGQPLICSEGHYPNGVYMIRAGFARLTKESDQGERTISYLRPESPYGYGLEEVIENYLSKREELVSSARTAPRMTLPYSLRAVGYADTVFFPTSVLERFVLPSYREKDLRALVRGEEVGKGLRGLKVVSEEVPSELRDFLVDHHLINGTQSMVINLDRCTRCDDCVRGCASTHERNPRFVRHGLVHGNLMVANSCMHCVDPVCLIDCPTGAIHRPLGGGLVVIQDATCIGCTACAHNCPYDNIRMVPIRDSKESIVATHQEGGGLGDPQLRATKCDLCHDQAAGETSCVRACPHDALRRVDLSDLGTLRDLAKWLE
jgi:Fe-S-cluster-containing dehydrogenase component/CRP-like cAMP-binding protein